MGSQRSIDHSFMAQLLAMIIPRRILQLALFEQWIKTLNPGDRARVLYWGATGNKDHHDFQWADELPADACNTDDPGLGF